MWWASDVAYAIIDDGLVGEYGWAIDLPWWTSVGGYLVAHVRGLTGTS